MGDDVTKDAYDNMMAWMSMNAPYCHMMTFKAALSCLAAVQAPVSAPATDGEANDLSWLQIEIALAKPENAENVKRWAKSIPALSSPEQIQGGSYGNEDRIQAG